MKKIIGQLSIFVSYLFLTNPVFAALEDITVPTPEEVHVTEFSPLIQGIIKIFFVVALVLTFIFLLWGGIQWILSGGDKTKYEEARNRITAALIGLTIVVLAWLIIRLVTYFFGLPDLFGGTTPVKLPKLY